MSRLLRIVAGAGALVGVLAILRIGSFLSYIAERHPEGVVRLAWRARGEHVRECRHRSAEELAKLPPHMRQEEVCEGRVLPYRLVVLLDGTERINREVRGAGAREDRPLYVTEDLAVAPGPHRVSVSFALEGAATAAAETDAHATPSRLTLDTTVTLAERRVLLVTYDEDRKTLISRY
ncbi:MAG: hypothetical protein ACM3OA_02675 [Acidobacteriota bacterium]